MKESILARIAEDAPIQPAMMADNEIGTSGMDASIVIADGPEAAIFCLMPRFRMYLDSKW
jgi:hypothetical protein